MAIYLAQLSTHTGTAAAHYIDADQHEITAAGTHQLFRDGRLVWQGQDTAVVAVRRFDDRLAAKRWHHANRHQRAAAEMAYRHEHHAGEGATPFVGRVTVRIKGAE